jgi:hypothetical protein
MRVKLDLTSLHLPYAVHDAKLVLPPSLLYEAIFRSVRCECGEFQISDAIFYEVIALDERFSPVQILQGRGNGDPDTISETSKEGLMPRVTIDTTEAQSFEAVEPGPYGMTIDRVDQKEAGSSAKNPGAPMIEVHFAFDDPAIAKKAGTVFRNYMLAGKGAGFTREFLKAVTGEDFPIGEVLDFDTDDLTGKHLIVQIGNREYEGRLQNEAERVVAAA